MSTIELLSPVGDFECLKAAVQNGCDCVYLGSDLFNARTSATNFDIPSLEKAIAYAKLRKVKTYLTLNTLIKEEEFEKAATLAQKAYEFGIDSIIVQDIGFALFLKKTFPDLPLHASTQMTIHNLEGALELQNLGFKRAVLARELSLSEIEYIHHNSQIELEIFIHGALCLSYSGQCLFSSLVGGRSANRGKCAQPCRLPYQLLKKKKQETEVLDNGYLLSPKDLCGLSMIPQLIEAGVRCLKIEGRMKKPNYVATVTRIYRKYIDLAQSNKPYEIEEEDQKDLLQVFNRGGFSTGHLDDEPNHDLIYPVKPHNIGLYLGNLSAVNPQKGLLTLTLNEIIEIGDTIAIDNERYTVSELMENKRNIAIGMIGQTVTIGRMKGNLNQGDCVYKLSCKALEEQIQKDLQQEAQSKKIPLLGTVLIQEGHPITLTVSTQKSNNPLLKNVTLTITSEVLPVAAKNQPITVDRVKTSLSKTKDTPFFFDDIQVDLGSNLFVPNIKAINDLRRLALTQLEETILAKTKRTVSIDLTKKIAENEKELQKGCTKGNLNSAPKEISILLNLLDPSFDYAKLTNVNRVYLPLRYFASRKQEELIRRISEHFDLYIYMPTIVKGNYRNLLINNLETAVEKYNIKGFVISNLGGLMLLDDFQKNPLYKNRFHYIGNYTLNIYNPSSARFYTDAGIDRITLSPELNKKELSALCQFTTIKPEIMIYGHTPIMYANYCLLGKTNRCYPTCGARCQEDDAKYYLKDRMGFEFRILPDQVQTVTTIFNSKITSIKPDFDCFSYRFNFLDESILQMNQIIQKVISGQKLEGSEYTNGNLNREI